MRERFTEPFGVLPVVLCGGLVLFGLVCLPLFEGQIHGGVDLTQNDFPSRVLYAHGLKHGRLNLWSPQLFRGYRLHGEGQTGMCHPWHVFLYGLFPPWASLWLDLAAAFPFGLLGGVLFFRRWDLSYSSSVFGASVLVFGSYFFAHFGHMSLLIVHAHLPWLLLFIDWCMRGKRSGLAGPIGVCCTVASALLLGHPQSVWQILLAGAVYVLTCGREPFVSRSGMVRGGRVLFSVVCGGLLGMVQVLPTLAALARSPRGDLGAGMRYNFSLHPANALQFLNPFFFKETTVGNSLLPGPGAAPVYNNNIAEYSVYGGCVLICLITAVLVSRWHVVFSGRRRRLLVFLFWLAGLGAVLSLGRWGGLFIALGWVPVIREFRCAARHVCFLQMSCAGLGAIAMEQLMRGTFRFRWRELAPVPLLLVCSGVIGILCRSVLQGTSFEPSRWPLQLVGPVFASAGMALLAFRDRIRWAQGALAFLCLADLGVFGLHIVLPVEDIALSEIGELYHAYEDPPPVNAELRLWAPANSGVWQGFYLANGYCGMPPDEPLDRDGPVTRSLRLASVGMLWSPDGWKDLPHALNRFRLVGRVVHDTPENRGVDVAVAARLSDPAAALPALTPGAGSLRLTRETPIRVDLQVETDSRQMLVCSDRFDPDWVATLDGNPAAILPLYNAALRGIVIPPGLHRVVMVYRSRSFRTGAVISGATALMLVLVGLWQLLRRRDGC